MPPPNKANRELHKEPPKQAASGRSMRQQAFMAFDVGMRPADVAKMITLSQATASRYFQQWKKLPPLFKQKYQLLKRYFRQLSQNDRTIIARALALELSTSEEEVLAQMGKPWAIKAIVTGEWRQWPVTKAKVTHRAMLHTKLQLLLRSSQAVRHILKVATNQDIDPLEDDFRRLAEDY